MLTVDKLGARIGRAFSIQGVSFQAAPGEVVAILGPNGSGKSTLLRLIAGLAVPSAGSIAWSDQVLSSGRRVHVAPDRRGISLLFQEGVLFPHLNVHDNVALGVDRAVSSSAADEAIRVALDRMRIGALASQGVTQLSGGEQQRVALARALVHHPKMLLLDEPFHSLDATVRRPIIADLRTMTRESSIATLFVTHDIEDAAALSDRVVLMHRGSKIQEGTIDELYHQPVDDWAGRFLGDVEALDASSAQAWGIGLPDGVGARVAFRPEDLVIAAADDRAETSLVLTAVHARGPWIEAELTAPDGTTMRCRAPGSSGMVTGQPVTARIARALPSCMSLEAPK